MFVLSFTFVHKHILSILTEINECDSHPCMNDATCHDETNAFNCTCADGYEGVNCENGTFLYLIPNFRKYLYVKEP